MHLRRAAPVLRVIGALIALVTTAAAVTMLVLQTRWGSERLRRFAVASVNRQIQGQLQIERLSFGGDKLVVWNATLRDPDGEPVVALARAEVDFSVVRLLREEIRLSAVTIETPRLTLVSDSRGLNLSRATAPREKAPEKPAKPKKAGQDEGWVVRLDRFDLRAGAVDLTAGEPGERVTRAHLANLGSFISARYATGNGALDLTFRLVGQSVLAPVGPMRLSADAVVHGDLVRVAVDGALLGGTIQARANLDPRRPSGADALVALAIPPLTLAGSEWGPIRIDGQAQPGSIPKLSVQLAIPGVELTGKGGPAEGGPAEGGPAEHDRFNFDGHLALADLGATAQAAHALTGVVAPPLAGHGAIDFAVGGAMAAPLASWGGRISAALERLRWNDGVIGRLSVAAEMRERALSAELKWGSPASLTLTAAGRLDDDQRGLTLARLVVTYPGARWANEETARLHFGDDSVSLQNFQLLSAGQALLIDGEKIGDSIKAHVALGKLRLDLLPAVLVDPALHLAGVLDLDVNAEGELANPKVVTRLRLERGGYKGFSKIEARLAATLADREVEGTAHAEAPFAALEAGFKLPMNPVAPPDAPVDMRIDVTRFDIAELLRGAQMANPKMAKAKASAANESTVRAGGRGTLSLRLGGSASSPTVDLTASGRELTVSRPPSAAPAKGPETIDVGHARLHVTYADRAARAVLDFASSQGGTLRVDAGAHVDLSYPRVTRGVVFAKLPIQGKVVARSLDVAWVSRFNERLEALGGQVSADARLAGTVGDPQVVGDVHWKNGNVVATQPRAKPVATAR